MQYLEKVSTGVKMRGFNIFVLILFVSASLLYDDVDGKSVAKPKQKPITKKKNVKIVNGDEVKPHSLPYMAAIQTFIDEKPVLCGGSLIATSLVLTAARCVKGASEAEITLGAHDIDKEESTQQQFTSSEFIIHPDYEDDDNRHDIAIIQLPAAVTLNENIATIPIPKLSDITTNYDEQLGLIAGWGKTSDTDPKSSSVLRAINVTIIPTVICELPYLLSLSGDQMCTTGVTQKNICLGDSGSPLVVNGVQVGIASYGSDFGCEVGLPGVHTRLTSYLSWLYIGGVKRSVQKPKKH
ncbi:hypothetical protein NQ315_006614 [Exocentrus adspersus]|uniref:Peptidase S1 domain-containing protein n=1 Tax=Exocentrus adspersus TaxID=1586481 RepID=A0AAV8VEG8_9CUCU|nr:hypothetical protein NQ315_006614 [Exocentrus adspersus]